MSSRLSRWRGRRAPPELTWSITTQSLKHVERYTVHLETPGTRRKQNQENTEERFRSSDLRTPDVQEQLHMALCCSPLLNQRELFSGSRVCQPCSPRTIFHRSPRLRTGC